MTYNQSTSFQPTSTRNVSGDVLPNPQGGDGSDYGIRFGLLNNRIVGDISCYEIYGAFPLDGPRAPLEAFVAIRAWLRSAAGTNGHQATSAPP